MSERAVLHKSRVSDTTLPTLSKVAPAGSYRSAWHGFDDRSVGQGEPLNRQTRAFMEPRFGYDFSAVRVHKDADSHKAARRLNATAFTVGSDIFLADKTGIGESTHGRRTLAHELGHVVQQNRVPAAERLAVDPVPTLESQALTAGDQVGRGETAGSLSPAKSLSIQRADDGQSVSFGVLDSVWVERAMSMAPVGGSMWPFAREGFRGMIEGVVNAPPEQKHRLVQKFHELTDGFGSMVDYGEGCLVGIGEGMWDSLKGIADLLLLGPRVCIKAVQWFRASGPSILKNFGKYAAEAAAIESAFDDLVAGAGSTLWKFLQHPIDSAIQLNAALDALKATGLQKAREAGHAISTKVFEFLEQGWYDIGKSVGKLLGMALFEVVLALATEGIANALKSVAVELARGAEVVAARAVQIFRWVGEAVEGFRTLLSRAGSAIAEAFADFIRPLTNLIERFKRFIAEAVEGFEAAATPEFALPRGGKVPGNVLMNEAKGTGKAVSPLRERPPVTATSSPKISTIAEAVAAAGKYDVTVASRQEALEVIRKAMPDAVELPEAFAGKPYPGPPDGVKKWFQLQPAEPNVGNHLPHVKYVDWTTGKKTSGGSWGHIFFPEAAK